MLAALLAVAGAFLWSQLEPVARPARETSKLVERALPGMKLLLPDGVVIENAGYLLAGRFASEDKGRGVRAQVGWSEAPGQLGRADLSAIQRAWVGALAASGLAPGLSEVPGEAQVAGHAAVRAVGLASGGAQFRAVSWVCPESQRVIHVVLSGTVKVDLEADERGMGAGSVCHDPAGKQTTGHRPPATGHRPFGSAPGPRGRLAVGAGWREVSVSGTRRNYLGPNGVIEVVLEEGPRPAQSPVAHVLASSELWAPLLTGVLGRPLPVDAPGANRIEKLGHGHEAVRVHGRVQPASTQGALAPVLYVETTVWVCPDSDRMVSLSAVTPDRKALERARSVLDAAVCH